MTLDTHFKTLGLPKHSDIVYLALEKEALLANILITKTRLHRPAVYRALHALTKRGFISTHTQGKRTYYRALGRKRVADAVRAHLQGVRIFEAGGPQHDTLPGVHFYSGPSGVTQVFLDVVTHCRRGDTFYRYTSETNLAEVNQLLPKDYRKKRDAKRLERLVISNPESGTQKHPRLERFIKTLSSDKEALHHNAIQLIYGSRMAFIDLNTYQSLIIENKTLADFQKTLFKALYKRLT